MNTIGILRAELLNIKIQLSQTLETIDNFNDRLNRLVSMDDGRIGQRREPSVIQQLFGEDTPFDFKKPPKKLDYPTSNLDGPSHIGTPLVPKSIIQGEPLRIKWKKELIDILSLDNKLLPEITTIVSNKYNLPYDSTYNRVSVALVDYQRKGLIAKDNGLYSLIKGV